MKKTLLSSALFIAAFFGTYFTMCYLIPGMRIKLAAEPMEYFLESIKHMAGFKSAVSLLAGLIAGNIPMIINRNKTK